MSNSSLIQTLPDAWRSSSGLAALASLGVHGLLFVLSPFVSLNSPPEQLPQNVPVVALTPEEQSRLPQGIPPTNQATIPSTGITQGDLPPLPSSGQVYQTDNLPPLPPTPSFLPPPPQINTPTYQYPISSSLPPAQIPTVPVPLPPPPQNSSSISQYPIAQLPQPQPNQNSKLDQTPLPPNPPLKSNLPSTTGLKPGETFSPPNTKQTQNPVALNNSNSQPTQRLAPSALPERTKQELIARRNAISTQRRSNNSQNQDSQRLAAGLQRQQQQTSTTPDTNQRLATALKRRQQQTSTTPESNQRLAATLQRQQQQNSNQRLAAAPQRQQQASSTTPDTNQRLAAVLQRRQQQPNAGSTQPQLSRATRQTIAQVNAFQQQQERVLQESPTVVLKPPIRQTIKTCNRQLDGDTAILAALINRSGKISRLDWLSKNSFPVQRAAKRFVNSYEFTKSDNPVNQSFSLKFTYDAKSCPVNK